MSLAEESLPFVPSYAEQRLAWRKSLNEVDCRALASEYLRGMVDECTTDAFKEFEYRYGPYVKGQKVSNIKVPGAKRGSGGGRSYGKKYGNTRYA